MKRNTAFLTPNARITEAYLRMRESVEDGKPATDDNAKRQLEFWKKLEGRPAKYKVGDKVKNNGRRGNGRGLKGEIVDVIQFKGKRPGYTVKVDGLSGEQSWSEEEMEPQKKPRAKVRRPHKIKGDGSKKGDYIEAEFTDTGVSESTVGREYAMPRFLQKKLHDIADSTENGEDVENAVIMAASELGYEVEDESTTPAKNEEGTYLHNVKLVKREPTVYGAEKVNSIWAHFNNPGPEYRKHRGEWYFYFM